ncbi:MAG TPA: hypothetical protein VN327_05220 [Pseudonocardiaceae bacterium]|jgi:hypothetical protein|nr:hypothetical protein [Pseudonocardiaceae bacterium]
MTWRPSWVSVVDLTEQLYLPPDRATVERRAALPGISLALNEFGPDEVPDARPRPLEQLVAWAEHANEHCDQGRYPLVGRDLGTLLTARGRASRILTEGIDELGPSACLRSEDTPRSRRDCVDEQWWFSGGVGG